MPQLNEKYSKCFIVVVNSFVYKLSPYHVVYRVLVILISKVIS